MADCSSIVLRLTFPTFISSVSWSSHFVLIPMLCITSKILFTSSILGILCKIVLPSLSKAAHKSPIAPFFEAFTVTSPDNFLPPFIKKSVLDGAFIINLRFKTLLIFAKVSVVKFCSPFSILATALCVVFNFCASCSCVMFLLERSDFIIRPICLFIVGFFI